MRISETSDGSWRAEEEYDDDGVIIYLTIKYHQDKDPVVTTLCDLGPLTTEVWGIFFNRENPFFSVNPMGEF